ncbi:MAG: response regulator [Cyanobacteria bacterium J06554_11]
MTAPKTPQKTPQKISKKILMIDDETDIQTVARIGLTMMKDWQVSTANSGREGIQQAKSHLPDVILLDVMMPDMDGLATLKALKSDAVTRPIPVIFLTAKSQAVNRRQFYELGAQGVIHKPFDPTTLASQISGFLGWPDF